MKAKKQWVRPEIIEIDVKGTVGPQSDGISTDYLS